MLALCRGWNKTPIALIEGRRYSEEEIARKVRVCYNPVTPLVRLPVWLRCCSDHIRLEKQSDIDLACKLICLQHNEGVSDESDDSLMLSQDESEEDDSDDYEVAVVLD